MKITTSCGAVIDTNNPELDLQKIKDKPPCCEFCTFSMCYEKSKSSLTYCTLKLNAFEKKDICPSFEYKEFELYLIHEKQKYFDKQKEKKRRQNIGVQLDMFNGK